MAIVLRNVTRVMLIALAACAGTPSHPARDPAVMARAFLMQDLRALKAPDEIRTRLKADLAQVELGYVGFEGVTLAKCIDDLVTEVLRSGAQQGDASESATLTASMDLYLAVLREARVRRSIGRDSCLPTIRPGSSQAR